MPEVLAVHGFDQTSVHVLRYLVVEEIVDGVVGLTVTDWPYADQAGRLRFDDSDDATGDDSFLLDVPLERLQSDLYDDFVERDPRVGDVFAVQVKSEHSSEAHDGRHVSWDRPLAGLFEDVYDISAEARKVAKLAYYASVADVWAHGQARDQKLLETADEAVDKHGEPVKAPQHPTLRPAGASEVDHG